MAEIGPAVVWNEIIEIADDVGWPACLAVERVLDRLCELGVAKRPPGEAGYAWSNPLGRVPIEEFREEE